MNGLTVVKAVVYTAGIVLTIGWIKVLGDAISGGLETE